MVQRRFLASPHSLLNIFEASLTSTSTLFMEEARRELCSIGNSLYLVGGSVRDLLLGIPTRDLDFAIQGDAIAMARVVGPKLGAIVTVHTRFGTANIKLPEASVDLVTARSETYPTPGSLPVVSVSSIEDDLGRRDFTINAMALSVAGPDQGNFLDFHHGRYDLEAGLIRILHDASFIDDPTRMLRAVRYEQRLGFRIERHTLSLIAEAVARRNLPTVGADRIRQELALILAEQEPNLSFLRMGEISLLEAVFPGLGKGENTRSIAESGESDSMVYLAALAFPLSVAEVEPFTQKLNMPRSWAIVVQDAVNLGRDEDELSQAALKPSNVVDILAGRVLPALRAASLLFSRQEARDRTLAYLDKWRHVRPRLTGHDLASMGVSNGPIVRRVLSELRRARLDGIVDSQSDELSLAGKILAEGRGAAHDG